MTIDIPAPTFPANSATAGYTVAWAMSNGLLPDQVQVSSYTPWGGSAQSFTAFCNPTLKALLASGVIPANALLSQIAFASPNANYGGN